MTEENQILLVALSNIKGIGNITLNSLLEEFVTPENLYHNFPLDRIKSIKKKTKIESQLKSKNILSNAEKIITESNENNISIISPNQSTYPILLKECADHPAYLFKKGNNNPNENILIAVVGTRNITSYGESFCKELALELKNYNVGIVSGLALGVDFQIHKSSLDLNIQNIGVLGSGLLNIYPREHQKVSDRIIEKGLLLSEYHPFTPPLPYNFPKRNRIIAGMTKATIIVESPIKGGSIITAKLANDYNREVYAVPGSVLQANSKGCNNLIKTHQANLLDDPSDLINLLNLKKQNKIIEGGCIKEEAFFKNDDEKKIYQVIKKQKEISIDKIYQLTQINLPILNGLLFSLELKNIIKQFPGKIYTL